MAIIFLIFISILAILYARIFGKSAEKTPEHLLTDSEEYNQVRKPDSLAKLKPGDFTLLE